MFSVRFALFHLDVNKELDYVTAFFRHQVSQFVVERISTIGNPVSVQ